MIEMSSAVVAADSLLHQLEEHTAAARALRSQVIDMSLLDIGRHLSEEAEYKGAERVAQIFSGVFFLGLAIWLLFTNGTKLSFVQRASLEKRLTVCCFINTYIAVFSTFFNFFQLTQVDNVAIPRRTAFNLDLARPFEWIVTCPMMQLVLVLMGGSRIPEYRRTLMPFLSAFGLGFATWAMIVEEDYRFFIFAGGFAVAMFMWYLNSKQIQEHSNGEENLMKGDSEFRKASVLLIATWLPFPCWFLLSPEGTGLLDDVLIIQVGWAFLNIVAKFTFVFYIQRIKDNYCNRLKVKREMYGIEKGGGAAVEDGSTSRAGMKPGFTGEHKAAGDLYAVVIDTLTYLGMAQHTDRFSRLLKRAQITSLDMCERLSKEQCEELQLPWDLVSALQGRIKVWSLEMRDTAEDELAKGEIHYEEAAASQQQEEALSSLVPNTVISEDRQERIFYGVPTRGLPSQGLPIGGVGGTIPALHNVGVDKVMQFGNVSPGRAYQPGDVHARLEKMEGLLEKQDRFTQRQEEFMNVMMLQRPDHTQQQHMQEFMNVMLQRHEGAQQQQMQHVSEVEQNLRRRLDFMEGQIIDSMQTSARGITTPVTAAWNAPESPRQGPATDVGRRLEDMIIESSDRLVDRTEKLLEILERNLQSKSDRQQNEFESSLVRKLEEMFVRCHERFEQVLNAKIFESKCSGDRDLFDPNSQMLQKIVVSMNQLEIGIESAHATQNKLVSSVGKLETTQENVHNAQTRRTNEVLEKLTAGLTQLELSQENLEKVHSHRNSEAYNQIIQRFEQFFEQGRGRQDRSMESVRSVLAADMQQLLNRSDQLLEAVRNFNAAEMQTVVHRSEQLIEMSRESSQSSRETRDIVCSVRELLGRNEDKQNNRMLDAIRSALQTDMETLLNRSDAILNGVNDGRDFQKENNADLRRHSMLILEQVSETKERTHMNTGQLADIQRSMMEQTMRFMRGMTDLGTSMSTGQETGLDRTGVVMVPAPVPLQESGSPRFPHAQTSSPGSSRPGSAGRLGRRMPLSSGMAPMQMSGQQPQMQPQMNMQTQPQTGRDTMM